MKAKVKCPLKGHFYYVTVKVKGKILVSAQYWPKKAWAQKYADELNQYFKGLK